jgi:hypothetical protein
MKIKKIYFIIYNKFHRFNGVYIYCHMVDMLLHHLKILNDVAPYIPLNVTKQHINHETNVR